MEPYLGIEIIEQGSTATIDGLKGKWVKIISSNGFTGWCFSGYLLPIEKNITKILAKEISHNKGELKYQFDSVPKDEFDLRTKLVYIPQRTEKWYGSLKDNLKFVLSNYGVNPEENETRTLMMIARLGLWNYKHLK